MRERERPQRERERERVRERERDRRNGGKSSNRIYLLLFGLTEISNLQWTYCNTIMKEDCEARVEATLSLFLFTSRKAKKRVMHLCSVLNFVVSFTIKQKGVNWF